MLNFLKREKISDQDRIALVEEYIDLYGKGMTNFAYTYLHDWGEAEEIVQEVFLTVYEKISTFKGGSSIKTWLYSITANRCKDLLRSSYKKRTVITDKIHLFMGGTVYSSEEQFSMTVDSMQLAKSVLSLPVKYREVIILYYYDEMNTKEISQLLSINNSTIRSRLQRGRNLLKERLEGGEGCESV
ncbi:sigma-70 family RNA polymerase sigma factor [Bacillus niameyensis]|uniref:sigma-70 family RNA polymerase sigma factor n=1 Tax=Bacillus niameyensis TaxID=1522308 RepID=UPI0007840DDD|nr:sigma-70 family RNA polymerase sigma factor [Bacillus niameyensis]